MPNHIHFTVFLFKSRTKANLMGNPHKIRPSGGSVTQTHPNSPKSFSIIHCQHLPSSNILNNFTLIEMKYCAFDRSSDYREPLNSRFTLARVLEKTNKKRSGLIWEGEGITIFKMRILSGPISSCAYRQPFIVNHIKIRKH